VEAARDEGAFPLVLSGNCGPAAIGCVAADASSAVFWFDAHADFNTPDTTISGFLDGMALAAVTGRCWPTLASTVRGFRPVREDAVVLIGARDLDPAEAALLDRSRIRRVSPASMRPELSAEIGLVAETCAGAYLHVDLDVLDPSVGRMNDYAAPGGVSREDVTWAIREIARNFLVVGAALTAFDPAVDTDRRALDAAVAIGLAVIDVAPAPAPVDEDE
jgi:arginase